MKNQTRASRDEVLEAFACEAETGKGTLEKYLREYPEYAESIIDLATEMSWEVVARSGPLSARELAIAEASWEEHAKLAPASLVDPFAGLSRLQTSELAELLEVPRQVLTALRDRAVRTASIPKRFIERLAEGIRSDVTTLMRYLEAPPVLNLTRSRKSETKPGITERKTFEEVLADAEMSSEDRKKLMAGD